MSRVEASDVSELRVLFDTREKHFGQNPYIRDLSDAVPGVKIDGFTWRRALFGRYDVIHVHWPEWLVKHNRRFLGGLMQVLTVVALVRWRSSGTPILRTVHNKAPHGALTSGAQAVVRRVEKQADRRVWLSVLDDEREKFGNYDVVIPHPDYNPLIKRLGVQLEGPPRQGRGLCFGSLVPYRKFEEVVGAAVGSSMSLVVAGAASNEVYTERLEEMSAQSQGRVRIARGRLSDEDLVAHILKSDVVFVPYDDLYNSGVIFLALTVGRPVAVRAGAMANQLIHEYGSTWIRTWTGVLNAPEFENIVSHATPGERPTSAAREWDAVGLAHRKVYEAMSVR